MTKTYKWTVEFEVEDTWIQDGYDLTDERAHAMIAKDLAWAYGHELKARVIKSPSKDELLKEQGYTVENGWTLEQIERVKKGLRPFETKYKFRAKETK